MAEIMTEVYIPPEWREINETASVSVNIGEAERIHVKDILVEAVLKSHVYTPFLAEAVVNAEVKNSSFS